MNQSVNMLTWPSSRLGRVHWTQPQLYRKLCLTVGPSTAASTCPYDLSNSVITQAMLRSAILFICNRYKWKTRYQREQTRACKSLERSTIWIVTQTVLWSWNKLCKGCFKLTYLRVAPRRGIMFVFDSVRPCARDTDFQAWD